MRAVVCEQLGNPEQLVLREDWPPAALGDNDVRIDVHAAGLNFPDVLMVQGKYQYQPPLPFVPGGEAAGVIAEVGAAVTQFKPGDRVISMGMAGAFCEQMVVPAAGLMPVPDGLEMEEAAGIGITYFTSYYALKQRAQLQPGETLLVLGAGGGVGLTAVEIGKLMGARVIACASSDDKLAAAAAKGADELINYSDGDLKEKIRAVAGKEGVDVVYDPVGGDFSEPALRCTAWKGRYLVIGFAGGYIPKIPLNLALLKGCSIVGVFWGAFAGAEPEVQEQNRQELWQYFAEGKLKPVIGDVFALERYVEAFACLSERQAKGKVILTMR